MKVIHIPVILLTITILLRCVNSTKPGGEGNGSETIARGVVLDSAGAPAAGVPVRLLPAAYDPVAKDTLPAQWRALTDAKGQYRLGDIAAGTYALEAGFASAAMKALVKNIEITGGKIEVAVDTGRLQKTGTVIVGLAGMTPRGGDYVYLPGTSAFTVIDAPDSVAGQAVLSNVPAGTFTNLIYVDVDNSQNTDLIKDAMAVHPGDTVASAYAAWKYTKQLFLNTTGSGADIPGNVYNFPLLVRLSDVTFNFSQAQSAGEDIRFAKPDGSPLACEIERWDPNERKAEIWVKVDTVYGNSSSQQIAMYWGASTMVSAGSATSPPNKAVVFDSATGFRGVWHLGDNGGTMLDATTNRFNGTRNGNQSRIAGTIGYGQYFDGSGDYTEVGNIGNPDTSGFTFCAWIKHAVAKKRQTIISKSKGSLPSSSYGWLITLDETGALQAFTASDTGVWGDPHSFVFTSKTVIADTSAWHHVAVVINRSGNKDCHLFIDGADVAISTGGDITTVGSIVNALSMKIGSDWNGDTKWNGSLDECCVSYRTRSMDWVRLCYMNQRVDDKLVVFK
jgi:hypothetical protein